MIAVTSLCVRSGDFELRDLTLEVPPGRYAVLMGRTGSGKSTLLEALCGLRPVHAGSIVLGGRDVTRLPPAHRGIGYVPQDRALFSHMTVRRQLEFALAVRGRAAAAADRVAELTDLLDLGPLLERLPAGLSGGEAQRVTLGRALAAEPAVLLLDEPLSALDDESWASACDVLARVQRTTRVTVLHVTHRHEEARRLADVAIELHAGRLTATMPRSPQEALPR